MELPGASLVNFCELFGETRRFLIPDYQRSYDWGEDQRADLLNDLSKLERLTSENPSAAHFCGTIICTPDEKLQDTFAIVDGQQRLTTLALLQSRLCRAIGKETFLSKTGTVRFKPQSQDESTFTNILNSRPPGETKTVGQANYAAAAKQIDEWINTNEAPKERMLALLENDLKFILFLLSDENEVAKVFETINNRGKPLTQMDLVKNHLIYVASVNDWETPNVNEVWREIQQLAGATHFDDADVDTVLRATVTAQFKPGRRNAGETDFKVVADRLRVDSPDYDEFRTFVEFLKTNFRTYRNLRNARSTDPKDPVMRAMTHLNHHDSVIGVLPLIFARQYLRDDDRSDAPILSAIEKTNFRLYGLRNGAARSDSYNVQLHNLAHEYFKKSVEDQKLIVRLTKIVTNTQMDGLNFIVQSLTLNDDDGYNFYNWPWRRYFLARYEEFLLDRQSFDFGRLSTRYGKSQRTNDYLSVEHIWPQKAENKFVEEYREGQQIRRLGNLMLLPHGLNITLSNDEPELKQIKMKNAKISLLIQNETFGGILEKSKEFVEKLQRREDWRFGATANRFNKPTIKTNRSLALVKTICDLREESMISFALEEWRLPGETGLNQIFTGIFSFAHDGETFDSYKETVSNKTHINYIVVPKHSKEPKDSKRLQARNKVLGGGIEPVRWS